MSLRTERGSGTFYSVHMSTGVALGEGVARPA